MVGFTYTILFMTAVCFCFSSGRVEASLRGILPAMDRHLKGTEEVRYLYTVEIEEEVEAEGPYDNDAGPSDDTVICMEISMASHMERIAAAFLEMQGHTTQSKKSSLNSIVFNQSEEKISLTMKNHIAAKLKVFHGGELTLKEVVVLGRRQLAKVAPPQVNRAKKKRQRLRRLRRLRLLSKIAKKTECALCFTDDNDANRRRTETWSSSEPMMSLSKFEEWMSDSLSDAIMKDCTQVTFLSSTFSREEERVETHASEPSTADQDEAVSSKGSQAQDSNKGVAPSKENSATQTSPETTECCSYNLKTCHEGGKFCNTSEYKCEKRCNGYWIDPGAREHCIALWGNCTEDVDGCCPGTICQGNQWYRQCKKGWE